MFKKLTLKNFKNFKDAELTLGPFTVIVGANATGKSNIREAFRFLHGIGRGYNLSEIFGEKLQGGSPIWSGIRGGINEVAYFDQKFFTLVADLELEIDNKLYQVTYSIEVGLSNHGLGPKIIKESLFAENQRIFEAESLSPYETPRKTHFLVGPKARDAYFGSSQDEPILTFFKDIDLYFNSKQVKEDWDPELALSVVKQARREIENMRFFEHNVQAMRLPAIPGQKTLSANGENLSSVLHTICQNPHSKRLLVEWIRDLSPMDVVDFKFPTDQAGRVLVTLVEPNEREISAYSASDGTLRFLATLASLLTPEPASLYFFEEVENGIHPSRLHLLLELIEQVTSQNNFQVIATTHSPQLLGLISGQTLEHASMTYRLDGQSDANIQRIVDLPGAKEIFQEEDLSRLYEKGWLENSVHFMQKMKEPA
jgi:predicted ATPase